MKVPNFRFCRGREHKTTTFSFFFSTLIKSFRIQLKNLCQHLTNETRWKKGDKVQGSANSLFKLLHVRLTVAFLVAYAPYYPEKQPTFCDATTVTTRLGSASDSSCRAGNFQKHCPDLRSYTSLVWNFCALFSDVISRGKQWWCREMTAFFQARLSQVSVTFRARGHF